MTATASGKRLMPRALALGVLAGTFVFDIFTPLGYAEWLAYLFPLTLLSNRLPSREVYLYGACATALIIGGGFLSPPGIAPVVALWNRGGLLALLWTLIGIVIRHQRICGTIEGLKEQLSRAGDPLLNVIFDEAFQFMGIMTPDGRLIRINRAALQAAGAREEDLVGLLFWDTAWWAHSPEARKKLREAVARAAAGEFIRFETTHITAAGATMFIDFSLKPVRDTAGKVIALVPEGRDISDIREAEQALRESEERFRATFEQSAVGITHVAPDGRWLRVNDRFTEMTRYSRERLLGLGFQDITHPDDIEEDVFLTGRMYAGEFDNFSMEKRYIRGDGTGEIWVHMTVSIIRDATGHGKYHSCIVQDISRRKALERELLLAKEKAEAATEARTEFIAATSHEFRTPMAGIIGMLNLILTEPDVTPGLARLAELARDSAEALLRLVEDLLDFSRLEVGKLSIENKPFPLRPCVRNAVETVSVKAREKGLALSWDVAADVPETVVGDGGRLRQILVNLVGNSVKFTSSGSVAVTVSTTPAGILFTVRDTGIGIPEDKRDRLFRLFSQLNEPGKGFGGAGIGLALSKQLVDRMGGSIRFESRPGEGSVFTVVLPLNLQEMVQDQP